MRVAECGLNIAVAFADDCSFGNAPRLEFGRRCARIECDRKLLDIEFDQVRGVFRKIRVGCKHRGDRIADISNPILRQHALAIGLEPLDPRQPEIDRRNIPDIGGGPDRHHARRGKRSARVDVADAAMREGRAHDTHVQLTRERDIGRKASPSGNQRGVLLAADGSTDQGHQRVRVTDRIPVRIS